ncbi:MAG: GFA family protein [Rhodospirillaceae bacterium]|jgi:hypothetical protein|nr:GFA family protein [Rhodospirillaceae bacterium]
MDEGLSGQGRCMCGPISFELSGPLRDVVFCHCDECRRGAGGFWSATATHVDRLNVKDPNDLLSWYQSSDQARRGFCSRCGSSLFFERTDGSGFIGVAAGALEKPTGLMASVHIFASEQGDYYQLDDGLRVIQDGSHGLRTPGF